jgi:S1-C subfamily serine protease
MKHNNRLSALFLFSAFLGNISWSQPKVFWTEQSAAEKKTSQPKADLLNESIVSLANKFSPAVVTVVTTSEVATPNMMQSDDVFEFFFGVPGQPRGGRPSPRQTRKEWVETSSLIL